MHNVCDQALGESTAEVCTARTKLCRTGGDRSGTLRIDSANQRTSNLTSGGRRAVQADAMLGAVGAETVPNSQALTR